ncbi:MAG: response regulator transcription factor [Sphingomonadales bacterium]|nr:response regulator transcription factor [Sphingomonadales bacterium]
MYDSVCVISADEIARQGLVHFLSSENFEVVCAVARLADVPASLHEETFLALIDVPDVDDQFDAVAELLHVAPDAFVVVLAEQFDLDATVGCFQAGARAYIVNSKRSQPLMAALKLVALGEKVMPSNLIDAFEYLPKWNATVVDTEAEYPPFNANLSPRERDVLCCLMAGYPNKTIARQLDVCEATVKVHVKAILRKLKVSNRTQAAIWASSNGMDQHSLPS